MPRPCEAPLRRPSDGAEPDDARGPACELPGAVALVRDLAAGVHLAGAHVVVGRHEVAVHGEEQCDRDLGDRIGVAAGRAQHRDPRLRRGRDVDVVGVASARADHAQIAVEDRTVHEVGLDDEDVGALFGDAAPRASRRRRGGAVPARSTGRTRRRRGTAASSMPSPRNGAVTRAVGRVPVIARILART